MSPTLYTKHLILMRAVHRSLVGCNTFTRDDNGLHAHQKLIVAVEARR
jgi:hypothetical protein